MNTLAEIRTRGAIGLTTSESTSDRASKPFRPDAPNVVVIVLDDTGFAQLGCYGSDISTPAIDGLADRGVRLTNFHTTAVCSPTRACLLTGRNHHRVGVGMLPGSSDELPRLHRSHPGRGRHPRRDPPRRRLRNIRGRQVAPDATRSAVTVGSVRELAPRQGVRALLRIPRRRRQPLGPRTRARQLLRRPAPHPGSGIPPVRRPCGRGDRPGASTPTRPTDSAVPVVVGPRSYACSAPRDARLDRPLPGPVRRGMGRMATSDARPSDRPRDRSTRDRAAVPVGTRRRLGRPRR